YDDLRTARVVTVIDEDEFRSEARTSEVLHVQICQEDVIRRNAGAKLVLAGGVLRQRPEPAHIVLVNVVGPGAEEAYAGRLVREHEAPEIAVHALDPE